MDKRIYLNRLYDSYKELFTKKQQEYFESYYWDNLSLSEIAENHGVSRNAIHNQLMIIEEKLNNYEKKLMFDDKKEKLFKEFEKDSETLKRIKSILV